MIVYVFPTLIVPVAKLFPIPFLLAMLAAGKVKVTVPLEPVLPVTVIVYSTPLLITFGVLILFIVNKLLFCVLVISDNSILFVSVTTIFESASTQLNLIVVCSPLRTVSFVGANVQTGPVVAILVTDICLLNVVPALSLNHT